MQRSNRAKDQFLGAPLSFFGGKGGVGKTTLAAAFALKLAARGQRTLLVSTDPAHSTSDVLGVRLGNEPTRVDDNLWALEIDPASDAAAYIERIKVDAREAVSAAVLDTVRQQLDLARSSPGTEEAALLDRLVDLMAWCPERFERIVFDTAPTGHTLRLLTLPALLSAWVEGLIRQREKVSGMQRLLQGLAGDPPPQEDPLLERLRARQARFHAARHRLLDDSAFYLVLIPERLPIEETARARAVLTDNGIHVGAIVINRLLPGSVEGEFMRARAEQQASYLGDIEHRFAAHPIVRVEQDSRDITQRAQLRRIAEQLEVFS